MVGFEWGAVEKKYGFKEGYGGEKENSGFKGGSPKKSSNFSVTAFVITQTAYKKTAVSDIPKVQIFPGWKFRILVSVFLLIQLSVRVARKELCT